MTVEGVRFRTKHRQSEFFQRLAQTIQAFLKRRGGFEALVVDAPFRVINIGLPRPASQQISYEVITDFIIPKLRFQARPTGPGQPFAERLRADVNDGANSRLLQQLREARELQVRVPDAE